MSQQRIGIFGGAFDPPHLAHRALAHTAIDALALDALHIIPTGEAWHKSRPLTAAPHRHAMCILNFQDMPGVVVDDREMERSGPSYTVDTVRELRQWYGDAQIFLCIGQDQALALTTWHRWRDLVSAAIICVAVRPDFTGNAEALNALGLIAPDYRTLPMAPMTVSATEIRQKLANQECVAGLVFEPVARYIDQHFLYQRT